MGRKGEMRSIKAIKGFLMQDRSNGNPRTNANDILQAEYNANVIASFQGEVLASSVIPMRRSRTDDELLHSRDINQDLRTSRRGIMLTRKYIPRSDSFAVPHTTGIMFINYAERLFWFTGEPVR